MSFTSTERTIVVPATPSQTILPISLLWPTSEPGDDLDYNLDISNDLADVGGDSITTISASVAPSGTGELQLKAISVLGGVITLELAGGVPGRLYVCKVQTGWASGRQKEYFPQLNVNPALAASPLPPPPSLDYGTVVSWSPGGIVFGIPFQPTDFSLVASSTSASTAATLDSWSNVVTSVVSGGVLNIPGGDWEGQMLVVNNGGYELTLQATSGAVVQVGQTVYSAGQVGVPSGGNVVLVTSAPNQLITVA